MQVNHKDGDKGNNCVDNLEYLTPKENTRHSMRLGLQILEGRANPNARLTAQDVTEIRHAWQQQRGKYGLRKELSEKYRVSTGTIHNIVNRTGE